MVPTFTIVTTIITIAVTAVLIAVFYRINNPARQRSRNDASGGDSGTTLTADRGNRDHNGDGGSSDGGGGDGGGD